MPSLAVLIVHGREAREAAEKLCGSVYTVMDWVDLNKSDGLKNISDANVLLWPAKDPSSVVAMHLAARELSKSNQEIKIIETKDVPKGWDAIQAVKDGWDWPKFRAWATENIWKFTEPPPPDPKITVNTQGPTQINIIAQDPDAPASPPTSTLEARWDKLGLARAKSGIPICNTDNIHRLLMREPVLKDFIWYDDFHRKYFTRWGCHENKRREWTDIDDLNFTLILQRDYGMAKLEDGMVNKAIRIAANQIIKNEPREWMTSLKWDGNPRIDTLFTEYYGAEASAYTFDVSRCFLLSIVARIYKPGCQQDHMVVLEGGQGAGKTRSLDVLADPWFVEAHQSIQDKDFYLMMQGKMIVEIAELDSFSKSEASKIKGVITARTDRFRAPYARAMADYPRQCVFVGTTNERNWQRDQTGARRFWPIEVHAVNREKLAADRDQLFAEAVHRFKSGESWYDVHKDQAQLQQERRRQVDEWESIVKEWLVTQLGGGVKTYQIAKEALDIDKANLGMFEQRRIAQAMRHAGWEIRHTVMGNLWYPYSLPQTPDAISYHASDSAESHPKI